MKKLFKGLAWLAGILILLVAIAVAVLVYLVDPNDYKDRIAAQASAALGQELQINGDLAWSFWPALAIRLNDIELANPAGFADAPMLRAGQLETSLQLLPLLKKSIAVNNIGIQDAEINIITNRSGVSNLDQMLAAPGDGAAEPESGDPARLSTGRISLTKVRLNLADLKTGANQTLVLDDAELDHFIPGDELAFKLKGQVLENGQPLLRPLSGSGRVIIPADNQPISFPELAVSGRLSGISQPLELQARLSLDTRDGTVLSLEDGRIKLGPDSMSLSATVASGKTNRISFDLQGEQLDLDRLLAAGESTGTSGESAEDSLEWLKTTRLDGKLKFASLRFSDIDLQSVDATVKSRNGVLTVAPIKGRAFDGSISGLLSADIRRQPALIKFQPVIQDIDIGKFMTHVSGQEMISARGDLKLDFSGRGLDPDALLSTLSGTGSYSFGNGLLQGIDISKLISEILSRESLQAVRSAFGGSTPFDKISGAISAEGGSISTPAMTLVSKDFDLKGDGSIQLLKNQLDYSIDLMVKDALKEQLAEQFSVLASGVIPISIDGALDAPSIGFDASALLQRQAESKLEEKKEEITSKLLDRLRKKD